MFFIGSKTALQKERFFFGLQVITFLSLISACATGPSRLEKEWVDDYFTSLRRLSPQTGFRAWQDFDLTQHEIILVDDQKQRAFRQASDGFHQVDYIQLSQSLQKDRSSSYSIRQNEQTQKNELIVFADTTKHRSLRSALKLTTHESFHAFYQADLKRFKTSPNNQTRANFYPLETFPRYFRNEMMRSLAEFLKSSDRRWLNRFSGWYFTWAKQFPYEWKNYADRVEGSAEYFSFQAMAFLHSSEDQDQHNRPSPLDKLIAAIPSGQIYGLDREAYPLGVLAGLALDKLGVQDWKSRVNQGESPLHLLAKRYKPFFQRSDQERLHFFLQRTVQEMEAIDKDGRLDDAIRALASKKGGRLVISMQKSTELSSFTATGFFNSFFDFPGLKQVTITSLLSPLSIGKSDFKVELPSSGVWIMGFAAACGEDMATVIPLRPGEFLVQNGQVKISGPLNYEGPFIKAAHSSGLEWICL